MAYGFFKREPPKWFVDMDFHLDDVQQRAPNEKSDPHSLLQTQLIFDMQSLVCSDRTAIEAAAMLLRLPDLCCCPPLRCFQDVSLAGGIDDIISGISRKQQQQKSSAAEGLLLPYFRNVARLASRSQQLQHVRWLLSDVSFPC